MKQQLTFLLSKLIKKVQLPSIRAGSIDVTAKVCSASNLLNVNLGRYSYVGNNCVIVHANIGAFSSIADNVAIGNAAHPIDRVSSSPVFHEGRNILNKNFTEFPFKPYQETIIGNDVWVGYNAIIKSGVTIGHGAVIGMGSVVTKNVGPYEVWAGNPAKLIKKRFDDKTICQLLEYCWWDLTDAEISDKAKYFDDPKLLLEKVK